MTSQDITQSIDYANENRDRHQQKFFDFLRIASISTSPEYKAEILQAAEWVLAELKRLGFDDCELIQTDGQPVVYGEWMKAGDDKPTVIIYAHYDVQPEDPLELWESAPFEPEIRDGKLYARGVVDDKSGIWGNLVVFESILETTGTLPINVKVFFEGEEECGSPNMDAFIKANMDKLDADLLIISDSGCTPPVPIIPYSVRGIIGGEVTVTGSANDFHSGIGGVVHNPIHMVSKIIASFHDDNGHILVPGAYEGAIPLTEAERKKFDDAEAQTIDILKQGFGDFSVWGEAEYNLVERMSARPSLDINGIYGGYQGDGSKTIIPSSAGFKVTMRLAPGKNPHEIGRNLKSHIMSFESDTLEITFELGDVMSYGALMLNEGPVIDALNQAYEAGWGHAIDFIRSGGSVPIIGMFQREMGLPIVAMGFGSGALVHAPNEYLLMKYFYQNIDTAIHFYHYLADAFSD